MKKGSNKILGYSGVNPFGDNSSKHATTKRILKDFQPTSTFWSLFNSQHEILIGTRGSGKTSLLKMMRFSMLSKLENDDAKRITNKCNFISIYVPLNLEFVKYFERIDLTRDKKLNYFYFSFNCLAAESLIDEIKAIIDTKFDEEWSLILNNKISKKLNSLWFDDDSKVSDLCDLAEKVQLYFNDYNPYMDASKISNSFTKDLGRVVRICKSYLENALSLTSEPTWIICVDEAEFIDELCQMSINSTLRGDSGGIVFKIATLPFHFKTYKTLVDKVELSNGNDFIFKHVDVPCDSDDFKRIAEGLYRSRIESILGTESSLEEFVGKVKLDRMKDYYSLELKGKTDQDLVIKKGIFEQLSVIKQESLLEKHSSIENVIADKKLKKSIFDKLAPIYYLREMYKLHRKGSTIPGWYAGVDVIRKSSQGNPRLYLGIMRCLFEVARKTTLTPKQQHKALLQFSNSFCDETNAVSHFGPIIKHFMDQISSYLQNRTHEEELKDGGNTFCLSLNKEKLQKNLSWIHEAVAYNRLSIDVNSLYYGVTEESKYTLANLYSISYWIPMRKYQYLQVLLDTNEDNKYPVKGDTGEEVEQMSLFKGGHDNEI